MAAKSKPMIKRKDGSYSQRGLWDNIRANKGSGKKPTEAMLKQEKKIKKAQSLADYEAAVAAMVRECQFQPDHGFLPPR